MIVLAVVLLGAIILALWHSAHGWCGKCNTQRQPRCDCREHNPHIRKPRYKL